VARIKAVSEPDPFWNWICLPHYDAGSRRQNEARSFTRAVIVVGKIHRSEQLGGICHASGVAPPYVRIRNDMTSLRRPIPDTGDTSFRAVYSKKDQVSLKPARSGFAGQLQPPAAGKGCFDRKAQPSPEIVGRPFQNFASRGDGGRIWDPTDSSGGQWNRGSSSRPRPSKSTNRVSVDFPDPFGRAITVRVDTLP
jgi:hypothetical protein